MSTAALVDEDDDKPILGFWIYLMTDCVLFATLFATYAVLYNNTNGGPSGYQLFNLKNVLAETLILLTSSFTCGLAMLRLTAMIASKHCSGLGLPSSLVLPSWRLN